MPEMVESSGSNPSFSDEYGGVYRLVEPGEFMMGDVSGKGHPNEQPAFLASITDPFFLAERLVSQAQWQDIMGSNPSKFQEGWSAGLRPVEQVDLNDVLAFIHRMNERDAGELRLGLLGEWRLPSEVEWEYAARAGTQGRWSFGEKDVELDEYGWHAGNAGGSTREVGLKKANPWGFHDMNGLVNEWCSDHWSRNYDGGRSQKPFHSSDAQRFVVRGGSWFTESDSTRNGARFFASRDKKSDGLGFRLVWAPSDHQTGEHQGASPSTGEQS